MTPTHQTRSGRSNGLQVGRGRLKTVRTLGRVDDVGVANAKRKAAIRRKVRGGVNGSKAASGTFPADPAAHGALQAGPTAGDFLQAS